MVRRNAPQAGRGRIFQSAFPLRGRRSCAGRLCSRTFRIDGNQRYSWIKNRRSWFVGRTRPCSLRLKTFNWCRSTAFSASSRNFDLNGKARTPEGKRAARSFRQLKRFHHVINSDKVFGTHNTVRDRPALTIVKRVNVEQTYRSHPMQCAGDYNLRPPRRSEETRLAFKIPACAPPAEPHYSPKYFSAIWMPSSYMLWNFPWNCSPRLVLREKIR